VNPRALEGIVHRHVTGRANHTLELHKVLSLELLCGRLQELAN
jgi:hypothetical protein